jgi:hypothetical protein
MTRCNRAADTFLEETVADAETAVRFLENMLSYYNRLPSLDEIRAALDGRDLACWYPLDEPYHADVLLRLANPTAQNDNP